MADSRIVGAGYYITVTDNGSGKCRLTFLSYNQPISEYYGNDWAGLWVVNCTTSVSGQILTVQKNADNNAIEYIDIDVNYPSGNWNTGDGVCPAVSATVSVHTTISAALTPLAPGDFFQLTPVDVYGFRNIQTGIVWTSAHTGCHYLGMSAYQKIKMTYGNNAPFIYGDANGSGAIIENLDFLHTDSMFLPYTNNFKVKIVRCIGRALQSAVRNTVTYGGSSTYGDIVISNNYFTNDHASIDYLIDFQRANLQGAIITNNIVFGQNGIRLLGAGTAQSLIGNNIAFCYGSCYSITGGNPNRTIENNFSSDTTGTSGKISKVPTDFKFYSNDIFNDPRITTGSDATSAGTNYETDGFVPTYDFNGKPRQSDPTPWDCGCSILEAYPGVYPAETVVLTGNAYGPNGNDYNGRWTKGNKTFMLVGNDFGVDGTSEVAAYVPDFPATTETIVGATTDGQPGVYYTTPINIVKKDETFGPNNSLVGTYVGGGTPPALPTLTIVDKQDGTGVTVTISGTDPTDINKFYVSDYAENDWTEEHSDTGNWSTDISLPVGEYHGFAERNDGNGFSYSLPMYFRVTDSATAESQYRVSRIEWLPNRSRKIVFLKKVDKPLTPA